jgi:hypothetical protein
MDEIRSTMTAVAEATRNQAQGPGPDAAWRRGRRRRAAAAGGGAALLSLALVAAVLVLARPQAATVAPAGGGGAAATTVPPSKAVPCPAEKPKLVACGESQGVAWEVKLTDLDRKQGEARLELRVAGGRDAGWFLPPLHSSGGADSGRPFTAPDGRKLRPYLGMFSPGAGGPPDPGVTRSIRIRYGDAKGRPTGAVLTTTLVRPRGLGDNRLWVAFIPADAWELGIDGLDAKGHLVPTTSGGSCSTPPEIPMLACPPEVLNQGPPPPTTK